MNAVLQVTIGLTFVFLIFSLVVSAANELILSLLQKRAKVLEAGIGELLQDRNVQNAAAAFWEHPLINSMSRGPKGRPSYVDTQTFVTTLLDLVRKGKLQDPNKPVTSADFTVLIGAIENTELRTALEALWPQSDNLGEFTARLEAWYNSSMERVSGWYKRYTQYTIFAVGVVCAVICNVDTLFITRTLATDPQLRDSLAQAAVDYYKTNGQLPNGAAQPAASKDHPAAPGATPAAGTLTGDVSPQDAFANLNKSIANLKGMTVPIGWKDNGSDKKLGERYTADNFTESWQTAVLGWLITALAGSLGAPFWFDMLNRIINIRAAGKSPVESPKGAAQADDSGATPAAA